jgi:hypothetical protein
MFSGPAFLVQGHLRREVKLLVAKKCTHAPTLNDRSTPEPPSPIYNLGLDGADYEEIPGKGKIDSGEACKAEGDYGVALSHDVKAVLALQSASSCDIFTSSTAIIVGDGTGAHAKLRMSGLISSAKAPSATFSKSKSKSNLFSPQ